MRVVSASRRTDIPAFYSEWFMNRARAGYALVPNPFNARQVTTVSLRPAQVACVAFCTKDPRPMLVHLNELDRLGLRYYFQVSLTGLPRIFEPGVPPARNIAEGMRQLARRLGSGRVIWRFDPVLISDLTPPQTVLRTFETLAAMLEGSVERVMMSFARPYRQTERVFRAEEVRKLRARFLDPESIIEEGAPLAASLAATADRHGMTLLSCAERVDLSGFGVPAGSCIDTALIRDLFGIVLPEKKDAGQRTECRCAPSVDLGIYGTCPHRCLYCYASRDDRLRRGAVHAPQGEHLLAPASPPPVAQPLLFQDRSP